MFIDLINLKYNWFVMSYSYKSLFTTMMLSIFFPSLGNDEIKLYIQNYVYKNRLKKNVFFTFRFHGVSVTEENKNRQRDREDHILQLILEDCICGRRLHFRNGTHLVKVAIFKWLTKNRPEKRQAAKIRIDRAAGHAYWTLLVKNDEMGAVGAAEGI